MAEGSTRNLEPPLIFICDLANKQKVHIGRESLASGGRGRGHKPFENLKKKLQNSSTEQRQKPFQTNNGIRTFACRNSKKITYPCPQQLQGLLLQSDLTRHSNTNHHLNPHPPTNSNTDLVPLTRISPTIHSLCLGLQQFRPLPRHTVTQLLLPSLPAPRNDPCPLARPSPS